MQCHYSILTKTCVHKTTSIRGIFRPAGNWVGLCAWTRMETTFDWFDVIGATEVWGYPPLSFADWNRTPDPNLANRVFAQE